MKELIQVKKPIIIKSTKKKKLCKSPYFNNNSNTTTITRKIRCCHQHAIGIKRKCSNTSIQGCYHHHEETNTNNNHELPNMIRFHNHVSCSQYFPPRIVYNSSINNRNNNMMSLVNCLSKRLPSEIMTTKCNKKSVSTFNSENHHKSCRCVKHTRGINTSHSNHEKLLHDSISYIIESIPSSFICNICRMNLSLSIEHFDECSIFRNTIKSLLLNEIQLTNADNDPCNNNDTTTSCCCRYNILIEEHIQYSVRHVCSNLCYLRAFAPYREWINLHQWILNQQELDHNSNFHNTNGKKKIQFDLLTKRLNDDWCCILLLPEKLMRCDDDDEWNEYCIHDDSKTIPSAQYKDIATLHSLNMIKETSAVHQGNVILPKIVFYNESINIVCTSRQKLLKELLLLSSIVHHNQDYYHQSSLLNLSSPERNANNSNLSVITYGSSEKPLRICPSSSHETKIYSSPSSLSNHPTTTMLSCQSFFNKQNMIHDLKPIKSISTTYLHHTNSPFGLIEELFIIDPWKLFICTILLNRTCRYQIDTILDIFLKNWPTPETLLLQQQTEKQQQNEDNNNDEVNDISSTLLYKSLSEVLRPLGINNKRAYGIIRFTNEFVNLLMMKTKQNESIIIKEEVTLKSQLFNNINNNQMNSKSQLSNNINNKMNIIMPFQQQQQQEYHQMSFNLTRKEILSLYGCGEYAADAYQIFIQCNIHIKPNDTYLCNYIDYQRSCI